MANKPAPNKKPKAKAGSKPKAKAKAGSDATPEWVQFTTRLSLSYAEKLRKASVKDDRPVMQYIRRVLEMHLDTRTKG